MQETREIPHVPFTEDMKKDYTILVPNMLPVQLKLITSIMKNYGYNMEVLETEGPQIAECGLKNVHNDTCYPALLVIGQFIDALESGKYDLHKVALMITQTGGGCRASNYIHLLRKALIKNGMGYIPVISLNFSGLEKNANPGFKLTLPLIQHGLYALIFGDIFMRCVYATRPYEKVPGSTDKLHRKWKKRVSQFVSEEKMLSHRKFNWMCRQIIKEFDELPRLDIKKPRVGIVGEILVKFHPEANNHLAELLESEGAEPVVPDLLDFLLYCLYNNKFKAEELGMSKKSARNSMLGIKAMEWLRSAARSAFEKSEHFDPPAHIDELAKYAKPIVSIGNQTGEGWFLTGEMMELIHSGVKNIVCTQPFACLPNHIVGKGVIKKIRHEYPDANIVAIDYDPGASEVNQLNRIKLMLSTAQKNLKRQ